MLHTMFQGHWSIGSREEDFLRFLPYMGMGAMLVMWPRPFEQLFFPKGPGGCIWNLVAIGPVVSEEKSFEIVDGRTDDRRTDNGACLYYSSPWAFGSGELKRLFNIREGSDYPAAWMTWSWHVQLHFSQLITAKWINFICTVAGWIAHYVPYCRVTGAYLPKKPGK